ncbi:MAG TPA: DUF6776 family protein, partial [Ktedonobacterales bacterium]|nr:DUF6776 family protein [Ktedonobacterales bacterium]
MLILLLAVAVSYGAFELGRASAGYSIVSAMLERLELRRQVHTLGNENETLQHRVTTAEIGQRVDRQAQSDAQRMIGDLQAETARQQQELQFYRGLVARQFGAGTLRVQELKIRPEQGRRFRVEITLVQAAARDNVVNGTVSFAIDGTRGGALVQLPLADVELNKRRELPFSLRFFQQIEVPIELPDQFRPASLQVEYGQGRGTERSRQTFTWR